MRALPTPADRATADALCVVPTDTGGLQIEIHTLTQDLEIEIGPDGRIVDVSLEEA